MIGDSPRQFLIHLRSFTRVLQLLESVCAPTIKYFALFERLQLYGSSEK